MTVSQGAVRRELSELQQQAHTAFAERTQDVDHQRDLLEQERRQIAAERARRRNAAKLQ